MLDYKHWITKSVAYDEHYVTKDVLNLMIDKIHHYVFHTSALEFDYEESSFKASFYKMMYITYYLDKPDGFIGHEVLLKRKGNESHRLVGLLIDGKRIPRAEMKVQKEEQDVGWVTSGTRSPTCSQGIALAYVRREFARVGTEVSIDVRGREAPCRVVKGAFHTN